MNMKEIRDDHYDVVGYTIDHGAGIEEHKDSHFNTVGYTIDQDKQYEDAMRSYQESLASPSGWPSLKENGRVCCFIMYGYHIALFLFPIIFLFSQASFIPAVLCFFFMYLIRYWWTYIAYEFFPTPGPCYDKRRAIMHLIGASCVTLEVLGILFNNFF